MSMKRIIVASALFIGGLGLISAQSYYDDDIYYNPDKEAKKKSELVVVKTQAETVSDYPAADTYTVYNTGSVRDVDEYNRRTIVEPDSTANPHIESFEYTRRIERFYDPQVVSSLGDPELVEYYYSSAQPEVNIIIGSTSFYNPWVWDWGWHSPYSYSYWGWSSWYWNSPYSWWRPSWYYSWYYPGPAWYPGWHPYPGHHPLPPPPGGGNRRWANGSPGGWATYGNRNGQPTRYNSSRGGVGYKPGQSGSNPSNNQGYRSGNRRGQGSSGNSSWQNTPTNNNNSRHSYNNGNSNSGRRSGISSGGYSGGYSGGNRGGISGGGYRGGGGRGGRR